MGSIPMTSTGPEDGGNFETHWKGSYLEAHVLTDVGRKRQRNEDSCAMCAPEDSRLATRLGYLFAVADGMGGVHGGEFASRLALTTLIEEYYLVDSKTLPARLEEAVSKGNSRVYQEAENNPDYRGMGTTASALAIHGNHAYLAQVGDSRIYLKRKGLGLVQITQDHSLVAEQVRSGLISEEEARHHSMKNLITRAVGTKDSVKTDLFTLEIQEGDTFLICSDGLSGVVEDQQIEAALEQDALQGAMRVLVGKALEGGAPDNVTVVGVRVVASPPQTEPQDGATRVRLNSQGFLARLFGRFS